MKVVNNIALFGAILLLSVCAPQQSNALIEDVLDVLHVVKEVVGGILKTWEVVQHSPLGKDIDFPLMREKQRKVLKRLKEVSLQISETEDTNAENVALAIQSVNAFIINGMPLLMKMNDVTDTMHRISARFDQMKQYEIYREKLEPSTLITFAEWTVAPNAYSVHHLMERLHLMIFGAEDKTNETANLLALLATAYQRFMHSYSSAAELDQRAVLDICEEVLRNNTKFSMLKIFADIDLYMVKQALYYRALLESTEQICTTQQSPQQFIYSLYTDIALTELKGYTMMEFSWMMLRIYGKGNFTQEAELMRIDYEKRTERSVRLLREIMRRAERILWRCDPDEYVAGKTYEEVTRLLQGYIENEVDLNTEDTCRETCDFYKSAQSSGCFKEKYCARQPRCSGRLHDCTFVDSDMMVCPAARNSSRRYEYIQYENGITYGKQTTCHRGLTNVDSWWRYLFWHCSYCFCLCDEKSQKSDRYFNLRETISDVANNKVVTGLRFVKHKRVFHLQIQEGELLPRGRINASTLSWKPVDDYNIFDSHVQNGRDFHTLTYESRSIDLDDVVTDNGVFVVTGVRFRLVGAHLNLEARLAEFNFELGKLKDHDMNSFWKSNDNTDVSGTPRRKVILNDPDASHYSIVKSLPNSDHNQYIDFTASSMRKDAAQSTVPFIDIQSVTSNPPVPLAGVGIYHKGRTGYGGFIAPKILTYDFAPHVQGRARA